MKRIKLFCKDAAFMLLALCIRALLAIQSFQGHRYMQLERQFKNLEKTQNDLIESNKTLITDIGVLSSSSRIEKIAIEDLDMHPAQSDEIVRVQVRIGEDSQKKKGGR